MRVGVRWLGSWAALVAVAGCGTQLPQGTTSFTVGRITVRTDSVLDLVGVVYRLSDTASVPPVGPVRHWLQSLTTELGDSTFAVARRPGRLPVSIILETYAAPDRPDTACGMVAPRTRRCFTGNEPMRAMVRDFIQAARRFGPRTAPIALEGVNSSARRRDLSDVYTALTGGKSLDSVVGAYTGERDLNFDVTLARTLATGNTAPAMDPARPVEPGVIFLGPDAVFPQRSYRSPTYVWLALVHQMAHAAVHRVLTARPELLDHGWALRPALEGEMARMGYTALFWDDALEEQLSRAVTIRVLAAAHPTVVWAARAEALTQGMTLVPWLEDALERYEAHRDSFPALADFVPALAGALDAIPTDPCRAAPSPGVALIGVAKHRALAGWVAPETPFRGLLVGDTVISVDEDSVSAGGLLLPTRQLIIRWSQHLPFELAYLGIRRRGATYAINGPVSYGPRLQVRVPSQSRAAVTPRSPSPDSLPICRWVTRARRR